MGHRCCHRRRGTPGEQRGVAALVEFDLGVRGRLAPGHQYALNSAPRLQNNFSAREHIAQSALAIAALLVHRHDALPERRRQLEPPFRIAARHVATQGRPALDKLSLAQRKIIVAQNGNLRAGRRFAVGKPDDALQIVAAPKLDEIRLRHGVGNRHLLRPVTRRLDLHQKTTIENEVRLARSRSVPDVAEFGTPVVRPSDAAEAQKQWHSDDTHLGIPPWPDRLRDGKRHIVKRRRTDHHVLRDGSAKSCRISRRTSHQPDVATDGETELSRLPVCHDRVQGASIQKEVVGLAIDGYGHGECVALVFHGHGPHSAIDLIGSSLEAFEAASLLRVLR